MQSMLPMCCTKNCTNKAFLIHKERVICGACYKRDTIKPPIRINTSWRLMREQKGNNYGQTEA